MKSKKPRITDDYMYLLAREGKVDEFNARRAKGEVCDFSGLDFRGVDLRGLDLEGINFSGSSFRLADLRGLDMHTCNLEGATIKEAKVSGACFPREVRAEEIRLSITYGTCMRYRAKP